MTTSRNIISRDRLAAVAPLLPWAAAFAVLGYAFIAGGYLVTVLSFALIYAIFVTGLNLFMGHAGQVSFGHNAFAALGGYGSAVLTATYGWPPLAAFGAGMALALGVALLVGYPTLRLRGHYLAMATLAIGLIVYEIAVQWQAVTGGYMGISGIPPLGIGRFEIVSDRTQLVVLALVVIVATWSAMRLRASRFGRALVAIAGSEDAARALGIDVAHYKLMAFLISAAYAALAGSLFVHVVGFVSPEVYGLHMVVLAFTMLYVGGIGTAAGPLIGAVIISLLPETVRALKDYQDLAYGAGLILLLIYAPKGLAALGDLIPKTSREIATVDNKETSKESPGSKESGKS
jgi:branched-chain amino acid transport system permease protein